MSEDSARRLVIMLLTFFQKGHSISTLTSRADEFPGYTAGELKEAALGLVASGFIAHRRGRTRAAVYSITKTGQATLDTLRALPD